MTIERYIENIVNECVHNMTRSKEEKLYESIRPIISEAVTEMVTEKGGKGKISAKALAKKLMKNPTFKKAAAEYMTDEDAYNGWSEALDGKTYSSFDNQADASKRRSVTQRLKDKKIDFAPIAYELWPNMSQDAARSWFSKKVNGKNESFTDEEISKVYQMLNTTMKESIRRSIHEGIEGESIDIDSLVSEWVNGDCENYENGMEGKGFFASYLLKERPGMEDGALVTVYFTAECTNLSYSGDGYNTPEETDYDIDTNVTDVVLDTFNSEPVSIINKPGVKSKAIDMADTTAEEYSQEIYEELQQKMDDARDDYYDYED